MGSKGGGKVDYTPMVQASDKAVALQSKIYEEQKQQAQPWLQAGQGALTSLQGRLGLTPGGTGDLMQTYSGQNLTDDPGYQFRLAQGQKAIERQQAAAGKYLTLKRRWRCSVTVKTLARKNTVMLTTASTKTRTCCLTAWPLCLAWVNSRPPNSNRLAANSAKALATFTAKSAMPLLMHRPPINQTVATCSTLFLVLVLRLVVPT